MSEPRQITSQELVELVRELDKTYPGRACEGARMDVRTMPAGMDEDWEDRGRCRVTIEGIGAPGQDYFTVQFSLGCRRGGDCLAYAFNAARPFWVGDPLRILAEMVAEVISKEDIDSGSTEEEQAARLDFRCAAEAVLGFTTADPGIGSPPTTTSP